MNRQVYMYIYIYIYIFKLRGKLQTRYLVTIYVCSYVRHIHYDRAPGLRRGVLGGEIARPMTPFGDTQSTPRCPSITIENAHSPHGMVRALPPKFDQAVCHTAFIFKYILYIIHIYIYIYIYEYIYIEREREKGRER